ncbi:hypothetical protein V6R21_07685 [Limibacter armeniacum]|uniref:hypothetical protein n=1 Tax=Limibacter armeniacum TaxID=466084 RepID=UPI002FE5642C
MAFDQITIPTEHMVDDDFENVGGIAREIAWAFLANVNTLPKPVVDKLSDTGNLEDIATISDDIVMETGQEFQRLEITEDTGNIVAAGAGEKDGKVAEETLTFFVPGNRKYIKALFRIWKNADMVFLVPDNDPEENVQLYGTKRFPARLDTYEYNSGAAKTDRKGATFTFKRTDVMESPIFEGGVITDETGPTYQTNLEYLKVTSGV